MRESEFCIPANNKAVISITPNWYDRRALDTRSNYALYSSLSHLGNLCQTSPKVRESLACDGGLEQLVRILRQGKICYTPEMFQLSKWQQSLLCIVNVGVRGSEAIRNRVIEAGIVPITVTILCNALEHIIQSHRALTVPTPVETLFEDAGTFSLDTGINRFVMSSSQEHAAVTRSTSVSPSLEVNLDHTRQTQLDLVTIRPHTRLPHPSPATPSNLGRLQGRLSRYRSRSNTLRIDPATFAESNSNNDNINNALPISDAMEFSGSPRISEGILADTDSIGQNMHGSQLPHDDHSSLSTRINEGAEYHTLASRSQTFSHISHSVDERTYADESQLIRLTSRSSTTWDQDVTLCLKLLAYLSKYPYLRPEFSQSHDVPRLRQNLKQFEMHYNSNVIGIFEQLDDDLSDSLQVPANVFQLVEKFTMRIHVSESTYWAGVIMRNSCRRHEQGGVRQCAYLECGKWETQNRQFAKCRRCRRTKYCSKACQSRAWTGHRYWCSSSNPSVETVN